MIGLMGTTMLRLSRTAALAALMLFVGLPAAQLAAQWTVGSKSPSGTYLCQRQDGQEIDSKYVSPQYASSRCSSFNILESWLIQVASAGPVVKVNVDADGKLDFGNRSGATTSPTTPSGWSLATAGDGAGSIDAVTSTNWAINAVGSSLGNLVYVHKSCGSGDCEISGEIQDNYDGSSLASLPNSANMQVGLTEGTPEVDFYFACYSPLGGPNAFNCANNEGGTLSITQGPTGISRPGYPAVTYDKSSTTLKGFYCPAGSSPPSGCQEIDSLVHDMSSVNCFVSGKSGSSTLNLTGNITDADCRTAIQAYTPSDPGVGGPTWDTQVENQSVQVGSMWTYDFTANVTCGNSPCTYSATGFPGSSGLSVSSAGAGSGMANANDLAGSPFNVTVTVTDASMNTADETFLFTVTNATPSACTGTTRQYTSATGFATINSEGAPGDCAEFAWDNTWTMTERFRPRPGVTYRDYGSGTNPPTFDCVNVALANQQGCIDISSTDDVQIQTIKVIQNHTSTQSFMIVTRNSDNTVLKDMIVDDSLQGGIAFLTDTNVTVDGVEYSNIIGNPHESLTLDNVNGFEVMNVYCHDSGHACINHKDNARNGSTHDSIFEAANVDPTVYFERSESIEFYGNTVSDNTGTSAQKPLISIGIEPFNDCTKRYNRDIYIHDNTFRTAAGYIGKVWIKSTAYTDCGAAQGNFGNLSADESLVSGIRFVHNDLVDSNRDGLSYWQAFHTQDDRPSPDFGDWDSNEFSCNIVYGTGIADAIKLGSSSGWTITTNFFQSGETGTLGTNPVQASSPLFTNYAGHDYTLQAGSPALSACYDGDDIGRTDL